MKGKMSMYQARRKAWDRFSHAALPADTLSLYGQAPELGGGTCLLCRPHSLCCFATVALGTPYTESTSGHLPGGGSLGRPLHCSGEPEGWLDTSREPFRPKILTLASGPVGTQ